MLNRHLSENVNWEDENKRDILLSNEPKPSYGALRNGLRKAIPEESVCAMFCGGDKCKYCHPYAHLPNCSMVIRGLYSNWVTENILAMSRPSTENIERFKIIEQMKELNIRSIINVQRPGEHASCGPPLEEEGFTYKPQQFMDNDIFFYNFGWKDFGVASFTTILDMVRVMQFALSEGKIAVHCHAGLGRTGVIIACYLIFNNRISGSEAIHYIREKRNNAIQSPEQVECILGFDKFLSNFRIVFSTQLNKLPTFNLNEYMRRQNSLIHGMERRKLKYIPKIVYVCLERILKLANLQQQKGDKDNSGFTHDLNSICKEAPLAFDEENKKRPPKSQGVPKKNDLKFDMSLDNTTCSTNKTPLRSDTLRRKSFTEDMHPGQMKSVIIESFDVKSDAEFQSQLDDLKNRFNTTESIWHEIETEIMDVSLLVGLVVDWLMHLKSPVLRAQDISDLLEPCTNPSDNLVKLEKSVKGTVEYLLKFVIAMQPLSDEEDEVLLLHLISCLTQQRICSDNLYQAQNKFGSQESLNSKSALDRRMMKPERARPLVRYFYALVDQLERKTKQPSHQ